MLLTGIVQFVDWMAMRIVHVTSDYPDTLNPAKTKAVQYLVDATRDVLEHRVYSLNRHAPSPGALVRAVLASPFSPPLPVSQPATEDLVAALRYSSPPFGLYLHTAMNRVADAIAEDLARTGFVPDAIHGHKLTMEGLIAEALASRFGVPFILSIQGNTDQKIYSVRADLRRRFRALYQTAALVFPFSVASMRFFDRVCGPRDPAAGTTIVLPCSSPQDRLIAPRETPPVLCSLYNLKDFKNKNVEPVLKASARIEKSIPEYGFDLYGGGEDRHVRAIKTLAEKAGATRFSLKGAIPHDTVQETFNAHCGMVQVSRRETFGMVYIEALLAGCPVIYPKDWAIDGFFDDARFAIPVPSNDGAAIEAAMRTLIAEQQSLKAEIAEWQAAGRFDVFRRDTIRRTYLDALGTLLPAA